MNRNNNDLDKSVTSSGYFPGASANNDTISGNNRRINLSDDRTTIPSYIMDFICTEKEKKKERFALGFSYSANSTKNIPSRLLYVKNLYQFCKETLLAIFECYGVIRELSKHEDLVLVRFQTLAMADKARTSIVEEFRKRRVNISIMYGKTVPTQRIWIGGMYPNTSEQEILANLVYPEHILNITWSRNFREAEAYILYRNVDVAQRSIEEIYRRGCILRSSQCPIQVGYTDICSYPFQRVNCQIVTEISDKCMTQISAKLIINSISASTTLHFIAEDCSIAENLLFQADCDFELNITSVSQSSMINLNNWYPYPYSIFLGIFKPDQEEASNQIIAYLTDIASAGFSITTIKHDTFVSVIVPPSYLSTYITTRYFEDFLPNDPRNQSFVVVIVLQNPPPSIIPPRLVI